MQYKLYNAEKHCWEDLNTDTDKCVGDNTYVSLLGMAYIVAASVVEVAKRLHKHKCVYLGCDVMQYRVTWSIDVDGKDEAEAVQAAYDTMFDPVYPPIYEVTQGVAKRMVPERLHKHEGLVKP